MPAAGRIGDLMGASAIALLAILRRIQRLNKVMDPVGDALPDWQILQGIARRLGYDDAGDSL